MDPLPMAPSCRLDETGLRAQYERYQTAAVGARLVERTGRRLVVDLDPRVDTELIERTIAIERECCPFFELTWDPSQRRLAVAVSQPEQQLALDAVAFAMGIEVPVQRAPSA